MESLMSTFSGIGRQRYSSGTGYGGKNNTVGFGNLLQTVTGQGNSLLGGGGRGGDDLNRLPQSLQQSQQRGDSAGPNYGDLLQGMLGNIGVNLDG